jgi:hypothetical protein
MLIKNKNLVELFLTKENNVFLTDAKTIFVFASVKKMLQP